MAGGRFKIVITECDHPTHDVEMNLVRAAGCDISLFQAKTQEEFIEAAKDADGILSQYFTISEELLSHLPRCRAIARYGVGYDNIDVEAATRRGVAIVNVPGYCTDDVATHTVGLLLALFRRIVLTDREVRSGMWSTQSVLSVTRTAGQTLGIVGLGRIGKSVAKKMHGFDMRIIAYDPYISESYMDVELTDFDRVLRESDFVSIHCPHNDETHHMFGDREFSLMKTTANLINTARGKIIKEEALIRALREGGIAGAALDVLEKEPPDSGNPVFAMDNVVVSPHTAFYSIQGYEEVKRRAAQTVLDVLEGKRPEDVVNPEVLE